MSEPRRTWVTVWDEWDPERDPALKRMAAVLAPPEPEPVAAAEYSAPEPEPVVPEPVAPPRRDRISELVARIRAGDLGAADMLRRLLDTTR